MKLLFATLLMTTTIAAPAAASSFLMLTRAPSQPSPSIIMFVEPGSPLAAATSVARATSSLAALARTDDVEHLSRSIVAIGEPPVEATTVASINSEDKPARNPNLPPMVIRGGLYGSAFPARAGAQEQPVPPASGGAETAAIPGSTPVTPPGDQRAPAPRAPAAPPPAAPVLSPE